MYPDDLIAKLKHEFMEGLAGPDAWDNALCQLYESVGFSSSSIHMVAANGQPIGGQFSSSVPQEIENVDLETMMHNPRYATSPYYRDKSARIFSDGHIISRRDAEKNDWFQTVAKPFECYSWLGGYVPMSNDISVFLSVSRGLDWIDPEPEQALFMKRVLQEFGGIFDTYLRREQHDAKCFLETEPVGSRVCLVRSDGHVVDYNEGFSKEIASKVGMSIKFGQLVFNKMEDQSRFERLIRMPLAGENTFITTCMADGKSRRIRLSPYPWSRIGPSAIVGALFIEAADSAIALDRELLASDYPDLTKTELTICELIVKGMSTEDMVASRGVAISTLRSQIRDLLQKLDCHERSQLIAKLIAYLKR